MKALVGVDGGGTKARAVAYRLDGADWSAEFPLGEGIAGPCNIALMSPGAAAAAVAEAVALAGIRPSEVAGICAAVAGYSFASRREPFVAEIRRIFATASVRLAPDYLAAFRGAFAAGRGIVIVAGTGSVAYAADGVGGSRRAGGYGYLIDDSGTGYGVGRAALAAVLRAIDGSGEATLLGERIAQATGIRDWDAAIEAVYGGRLDRVAVAALSRIVADVAAEGDHIATRILMRAGGALARLAEAVYAPVFGSERDGSVEVALAGSLWQSGGAMTEVFSRSIARFAPTARFALCEVDPAAGAAQLAADLIHGSV